MITEILNNLHFLRPEWFLAFIGLALYLLLMIKKQSHNVNWQKICDSSLRPYILTSKKGKHSMLPVLLTFIAATLCITALAGPVYKKLPQPVFREQSALVILLDLSQSMNATDIKPSRLERTKLELLDILKQRHGGQSALIVYAADAFTVTPLTDDNGTIANLVPSLETSMMPAQGSNLTLALVKAHDLFIQSGVSQGDVLVMTDGIHKKSTQAIKRMLAQGYRVSIFGIGTAAGSPIPLANGFLQDSNGAIVIPKLNIPRLQRMALAGGGLYTGIKADDSDTQKLSRLFASRTGQITPASKINLKTDLRADSWQEDGVWLVLPLLFFAALWLRKGWLASFVIMTIIFTLPVPQPTYAASTKTDTKINKPAAISANTHSPTLSLANLWLTPDQKAMQAFKKGDTKTAAETFKNPTWKASALYRNGNYAAAAKLFMKNIADQKHNKTKITGSSDNFYNTGNALAKAGLYKPALAAYKKAIELNKSNKDAIFNRNLVKKALQKKQQKQQQNKSAENKNKHAAKNKQNKQKQNNQKQNNKSSSAQNNQQNQNKKKQDKNNKAKRNQSKQNQSEEKKQRDEKFKKSHPDNAKSKQQHEQQVLKNKQQKQKEQAKDEKDKTKRDKNQPPQEKEVNPRETAVSEDKKATEQWLRRIPDDPGGLLRRKFLYQYKHLPNQHNSQQPW